MGSDTAFPAAGAHRAHSRPSSAAHAAVMGCAATVAGLSHTVVIELACGMVRTLAGASSSRSATRAGPAGLADPVPLPLVARTDTVTACPAGAGTAVPVAG
jgi:hypothetical protein